MTSISHIFKTINHKYSNNCLSISNYGSDEGEKQEQLVDIIESTCKEYQMDHQIDFIKNEYFSLGPITPLLNQVGISEIIINGPQSIWFEKNQTFHCLDNVFNSQITFNNFVHRICKLANIKYDLNHPCVNGSYKNFRIHIASPPITPSIQITIRKNNFSKPRLSELFKRNNSSSLIELLKNCLNSKKSTLIIGPTGSGKTTLLNALLQEDNTTTRNIIIEDTSEITLPNKLSSKLLTRTDKSKELSDYTQQDLLKEALRMRPQRIVMGEVRGKEAKDLLMAFSTGHSNGFATLHADSPKQALLRLEMLIQLGAPQWNIQSIRTLIYLGIEFIVSLNAKREIISIYRISGAEEQHLLLHPLWKL